ncbi:serine/threonine dehydratase [Nocardioides zeae]|uniref:Serine/threonine dehydratase n=1 Tax=Nocardioides imazamoxiresistens TaxID=3231893 RepID=A0ABU3Q238_9ACTN|nr:serine/threonine dehydratase [Nocardioides zeae]MDT9595206.1 serine/threonine dehydratase [Nocardioides zeae]
MSAAVPTRAEIGAAAVAIAPYVRRTPVLDAVVGGHPATLKLELLQHAGSFKPRGAFASVLAASTRPERLVAASGGNHGLAVAHVGATLGIPAEIFVPATAPAVKVAGLRARGARVHQVGATYAEAYAASADAAAAPGALALHAYDAPLTVTGQGTLGRELEEQVVALGAEAPDTVVVAVGGGGLAGGVAAWFAGTPTRVVAVEPTGCPTLHAALAAGEPVAVAPGGVAADSLGASRIGAIGFAALRHATSVLVEDADVLDARRWLWDELRLVAEPGGAAAVAALRSGAYVPAPGERVAVVVCGANTDPSDLVREHRAGG